MGGRNRMEEKRKNIKSVWSEEEKQNWVEDMQKERIEKAWSRNGET